MQSAPLRPVRLLALHGYPGSFGCAAEVDPLLALSEAMRDQGFALSIVAPRAPTAADSTGNPRVEEGVAWIAGDQTSAGKVVGFGRRDLMSDPHTTAPPFSPDELPVLTEEDNVWHGAVGFDASLRLLELAWDTAARENSPFDGVLGFSQGALTAAIFLAFLQQQHRSPPPYLSSISATSLRRPLGHHRRARRPDAPPPRFAILCGGFRRPWPAEAGGYWPPPQSSPLPTPSLHVIGERDTVVAPCRSEELLAAFVGPSVHRHDLVGEPAAMGGHVVPWDEPFYVSVAALLAGAVT